MPMHQLPIMIDELARQRSQDFVARADQQRLIREARSVARQARTQRETKPSALKQRLKDFLEWLGREPIH